MNTVVSGLVRQSREIRRLVEKEDIKPWERRWPKSERGILGEKEKDVLDVVSQFMELTGVAPTCEEIAEILGLNSASLAWYYLHKLQNKGWLHLGSGRARWQVLM